MLAKLALAGITGPLWFTVLVIVQSLLQPDYDHLSLPISALAAWPYGWLQNLNFFVFGSLMIAYAIGLHRGVQSGRTGWIGFAFLLVSGVGLLVAGFFPWRRTEGDFIVPAGHVVGAMMSFLGAGIGLMTMSRRMAGDQNWRRVSTYALASGVAMVVMSLLIRLLAVDDNAPLHAWAGLLQRLVLVVWFPCTIVLGVRLRHLAKQMRHRSDVPSGSRR